MSHDVYVVQEDEKRAFESEAGSGFVYHGLNKLENHYECSFISPDGRQCYVSPTGMRGKGALETAKASGQAAKSWGAKNLSDRLSD